MATETQSASLPPRGQPPKHEHGIEMPLPTAYPFVLSVGVTMFGFGLATSLAISAVGLVIFVLGIIGWVGEMLPGRGHGHEEPAPEALRAKPVVGQTGLVEQLQPGMAGYRFRLPEKVHPISAGVWGGIVGGLVMPIPALLYGVISGKGFWFPVNLLAGMVMPGLEDRTKEQLGQFDLGLFIVAVAIHITMAVVLGLMYGVLLPTLPDISRPVAWGGLLMPLLWTAVTYSAMRIVDPDLNAQRLLAVVHLLAIYLRDGGGADVPARAAAWDGRRRSPGRGGGRSGAADPGAAVVAGGRPRTVVSGEPAGRDSADPQSQGTGAVSRRLAGHRARDSCGPVAGFRPDLRPAAGEVAGLSRTAGLGRHPDATALDGNELRADRSGQPGDGEVRGLGVFPDLADRLRRGRLDRGDPDRGSAHSARRAWSRTHSTAGMQP